LFQRLFPIIFLFASIIAASAQAPSAPGKQLPPGPMQAKVKADCSACHSVSRIAEQHFTRKQWSDELVKMEGLGAMIADSDRNAILSYLAKSFGPAKTGTKSGTAAAPKQTGETN
jgi:hypothetical protein